MSLGYVKLWRKTLDSGLLQMPNTLSLFLYLLIQASHKHRKHGMEELKPGQYVSGRKVLAKELKQSEQEIRTSLEKLVTLEILTIKSTNKYSIYTIVNYEKYQTSEGEATSNLTNKQPASNQQATTKQECKNVSMEEKDTLSGKPDDRKLAIELLEFLNQKSGKDFRAVDANIKMIQARLREYPVQDLKSMIALKCRSWRNDEVMAQYMRPGTLFNAMKCAQYIGELIQENGNGA